MSLKEHVFAGKVSIKLLVITCFAILFLSACSGGGSGTSPEPFEDPKAVLLTGLFASGAGIEGQITIRGSAGKEVAAFSRSDGSFMVDVRQLQAPYRIRGEGFDSDAVFYSISDVAQYTNVNQLTTAVMRSGLNGENLETFFTGFSDEQRLPAQVLAEAEEALKQGLLVEILGNGVNPENLSIFRTVFVPNRLSYDALLEAVDDRAVPISADDVSEEHARSMLRILAKFFVTDSAGRTVPNYDKLTLTVFDGYVKTIEQELIEQQHVLPLPYADGELMYLATTEASRNIAKQIIFEIATAEAVEVFGQIVGFSEADIIFLQEVASIPLQANLLNALMTMYRGLQGEDTSLQTQSLLDALEASSFGPERRVDTARAFNLFFIGGFKEYLACELSLEDHFESVNQCRLRDRNASRDSEFGVDFDTGQLVSVTEEPSRLAVQELHPAPGAHDSDSIVRDPIVRIRWAGPIWQGTASRDLDRQAVTIQLSEEGSGHYQDCEAIRFPDDRSAECRFPAGRISYDQTYTLSIVAEARQVGLVSHVLSTFTTPAYPSPSVSVSPATGVYETSVDVQLDYVGAGQLRYVTNSPKINAQYSLSVPANGQLVFDTNVTFAVAAFDGNTRVSPVVRRAYVITEATAPEPPTLEPDSAPPGEPLVTLAAPQNVSLTASPNRLSLSWARVNGANGYAIYVSANEPPEPQGLLTQRYTVSGPPFRIPNVAAGVTYQVMLSAVHAGIESDFSSVVSGVAESLPVIPDDLIDSDQDDLPDTWETANGTDPFNPDTDGDSILDGAEVGTLNNPRDTDGDALIDVLDPVNEDPCVPSRSDDACRGDASIKSIYPLFALSDVETTVIVDGSGLPDRMTLRVTGGRECIPGSFLTQNQKRFDCLLSGAPDTIVSLTANAPGGDTIPGPLLQVTIVNSLPRLTGISPVSIPAGVPTQVFLSGSGLPNDITLSGLADGVSCSIEATTSTLITLSCLASSSISEQASNSPELIIFRDSGAYAINGSGDFSFSVNADDVDDVPPASSDISFYRLIAKPDGSTSVEFGIALDICAATGADGQPLWPPSGDPNIDALFCNPGVASSVTATMSNRMVGAQGAITENPTECDVRESRPGYASGSCNTAIKGSQRVFIAFYDESNSFVNSIGFIADF